MFLDTSAWFHYLAGDRLGKEVQHQIELAHGVYTCPIVLAELVSKLLRAGEDAQAHVARILAMAGVIDHDAAISVSAGRIHAQMRETSKSFSMADAFVLAAARSRGLVVLTADNDFAGIPDARVLR